MNNTLSITEYNLLDYSLKLQEAVEKGYRINDSVEGSPMMVGFVYTATLVKREEDVVGELAVKGTTELQEQLKQGDVEQAIEAALVVENKVEETVNKAPSKRGRK